MNTITTYKEIRPRGKPLETALVKGLLFVLGRGAQAIARFDEEVNKEVTRWEDSFSVMFEILPDGPRVSLQKMNGKLIYRGLQKTEADLVITFKNIDAAFLIFTARLSTPEGYARKLIMIKGDINKAMSLIRCMRIIQFILFPRFIARSILKRLPRLTLRRWGIRFYTYLIAVPLGV